MQQQQQQIPDLGAIPPPTLPATSPVPVPGSIHGYIPVPMSVSVQDGGRIVAQVVPVVAAGPALPAPVGLGATPTPVVVPQNRTPMIKNLGYHDVESQCAEFPGLGSLTTALPQPQVNTDLFCRSLTERMWCPQNEGLSKQVNVT